MEMLLLYILIARTRILISTLPNFQFVLSMTIRYRSSSGSNENIISVSKIYSAIKYRISLKDDSALTSVSKLADSFSK